MLRHGGISIMNMIQSILYNLFLHRNTNRCDRCLNFEAQHRCCDNLYCRWLKRNKVTKRSASTTCNTAGNYCVISYVTRYKAIGNWEEDAPRSVVAAVV